MRTVCVSNRLIRRRLPELRHNDARGATAAVDPATPLVRTKGAEIGFRSAPSSRFHLTAALWALDMASELVFAGDAGTTEASLPSRRLGVELAGSVSLRDWLLLDADYADSYARFSNGSRIPGAVEGVASAALSVVDRSRFSGELRYRYFGPRPLIEDNSVRSSSASTVNARISYAFASGLRLDVDAFNLFNARVSDVDYFYTSRLRGEPAAGVDDVHFHPLESRSLRVAVRTTF